MRKKYLIKYKVPLQPVSVKVEKATKLELFKQRQRAKKQRIADILTVKVFELEEAGVTVLFCFKNVATISVEMVLQMVSVIEQWPDVLQVEEDKEPQPLTNPWTIPQPSGWNTESTDPSPQWVQWVWGYLHEAAGGSPCPDADAVFLGLGSGVGVAILDSGIGSAFPEINANYKPGSGSLAVDLSNSAHSYNDVYGHGTMCAGIIGAAHGSTGIVGIAPECIFHNVKVWRASGDPPGSGGGPTGVQAGLDYCLDHIDQVDVINLSMGGGAFSAISQTSRELIEDLSDGGVLISVSAGNDGLSNCCQGDAINDYAVEGYAFAVGALEYYYGDYQKINYSSVGSGLDFILPINGASPMNYDIMYSGMTVTYPITWGYRTAGGTSSAAPALAGILALMKSYDPDIIFSEAYEILKKASYTRGKAFYQQFIENCPSYILPENQVVFYSTEADGVISIYNEEGWSAVQGSAIGETVDIETKGPYYALTAIAEGGDNYSLYRSFLYFDLSGFDLTGKIITAAKLTLITAGYDDSYGCVQEGTQGDILSINDFASFIGDYFGKCNWVDEVGCDILEFNEEGLAYINNVAEIRGSAKLCLREYTHDYLNVVPTGNHRNGFIMADYKGVGNDPKLTLTYEFVPPVFPELSSFIRVRDAYEKEIDDMPITDIHTDIAALSWNVGDNKTDLRTINLKIEESHKIANVYPYIVRLNELPYETSGMSVFGYSIVSHMPSISSECYVDYEGGMMHFHSTEANKIATISYYGKGSMVHADGVNRFSNFLCQNKDALLAFSAEATDPVSKSVLIAGGYILIGQVLTKLPDKLIEFGTGKAFELSAMSVSYYRKVLIGVNILTGNYTVTEGTTHAVAVRVPYPGIPANTKPCVCILVHDDGSGGAGTIHNIGTIHIEDIRTFIRA